MYLVESCPICSGNSFQEILSAKDYTVSHETFQIVKCITCDFLLTNPRPDEEKIGNYYLSDSYVSHTASAKTIFDKIYEQARLYTLNWKLTLVKKFMTSNDKPSLLDYGCGTGFFLQQMQSNGFEIAGVEPSLIARTNAEKITGIKIDSDLSLVQGRFDIITLWHVLEHVSNLNDTIEELKNRLKKNATLIIAVPNYKSEDAKLYGPTWAGYDVPRHLWHFEQKTMHQLLAKHKMKIIETIPMKLDAVYVSMLSEKYRANGQSILTFAKGLYQGLLSNLKAKNKNYSSLIYIARHE